MIKNIYADINTALAGLDLKQAKEFFSFDQIPDSLTDKSYFINLPVLENGSMAGASANRNAKIYNLQFNLKISLCRKTTANKVQTFIVDIAELIEDIIKAILALPVGEDEKDEIDFVGSESIQSGVHVITEINFNINYHINDL